MRFRGFLALTALLLALAAPAYAEHGGATLDRILPEIRAAHPGRLSDAQPWTDENGRTHYRIKWMTLEGRILYFDADASTGRISNSGGDDGEHWRGGNNWRGGDRRWQGDLRDDSGERRRPPDPEDRGGGRDNWNGDSGGWPGGRWRDHNDGGDWRGGRDPGDNGGWHHREHGGH